jgi:hypothetical protein
MIARLETAGAQPVTPTRTPFMPETG